MCTRTACVELQSAGSGGAGRRGARCASDAARLSTPQSARALLWVADESRRDRWPMEGDAGPLPPLQSLDNDQTEWLVAKTNRARLATLLPARRPRCLPPRPTEDCHQATAGRCSPTARLAGGKRSVMRLPLGTIQGLEHADRSLIQGVAVVVWQRSTDPATSPAS